MGVLQELHRRNVFRVAVAYVVTTWLLLQVADVVLEAIGAPGWVMQGFMSLLALGFIPAVLFAWAFEVTPEGIRHESEVDRNESITHVTGHKLDIAIIVMLVVIGGFVFWEKRVREQPAGAAATVTGEAPAATAAADLPQDKSIAVLPFVNLSSDPEQEYFSDGISEELLNVLAQIPDLRVAARTSSFQFKGDNRNIGEIAQLLKVNHVLEGSVRKAGTQLRITAQLIEAENGYHLWSQTYDRELKDVFAIQDEISMAIGEALKAQLQLDAGSARSDASPRVAETANTAAYESYLKGRYLVNQRGNRAITEAVRELEKAIRLDPNYAPAQAQLAIAYAMLHNSPSSYGDYTTAQVNNRARPHVEAARAINPELPELWGARAMLASVNEDNEAALAYATRAVELSPVYIDALNWKNNAALNLGRYRDAKKTIEKLLAVDPLSIVGQLNYSSQYLAVTDPEAARRMATRLAGQHKWAGYVALANIANRQGALAESLRWLLLAFAEDPLDRFSNQAMAARFSRVDLYPEAVRVADNTRAVAEFEASHFEAAAGVLREELRLDPDSLLAAFSLNAAHYYLGDFERARAFYDDWVSENQGRHYLGSGYGVFEGLRHTWMLRAAGSGEAAAAVLAEVDADLAAREGTPFAAGPNVLAARGMRAWLAGDRERSLELLRIAVQSGFRDRLTLMDPMFQTLRGDPQFREILAELDSLLLAERNKVLELVCRDNPIPDYWQPLTATCAG